MSYEIADEFTASQACNELKALQAAAAAVIELEAALTKLAEEHPDLDAALATITDEVTPTINRVSDELRDKIRKYETNEV